MRGDGAKELHESLRGALASSSSWACYPVPAKEMFVAVTTTLAAASSANAGTAQGSVT